MDDGSAIAVAETMISNRGRDRTALAYRQTLLKLGKWPKVNGGGVGDDDMPILRWVRPIPWLFSVSS